MARHAEKMAFFVRYTVARFFPLFFKAGIFNMYRQMGKLSLLRDGDIPPLNSTVYGLRIGKTSLEIFQIM